jgi:hypothetical protein
VKTCVTFHSALVLVRSVECRFYGCGMKLHLFLFSTVSARNFIHELGVELLFVNCYVSHKKYGNSFAVCLVESGLFV